VNELTQIGVLGGMSWESTALYYRRINELVRLRVGGHASAPLLIWSVDFAGIEARQRSGDWDGQGQILATAAVKLEAAGVAAIALATNTLHLVADQITAAIDVPFIDLVDVTASAMSEAGYRSVGLLATAYTMTIGSPSTESTPSSPTRLIGPWSTGSSTTSWSKGLSRTNRVSCTWT